MNIKLKGSLRTEKTTLNVLLAVGIIAFFISFTIEVPLQKWMRYSTYHKLHLDYMSNVMLGVAASSAISYISLHFFFIKKRNDQINSVLLALKGIYIDYKHLYSLVYYKATGNEKKETYYFEKNILEKVKKLEKAISDVSTLYGNSEFYSDNMSLTIKSLQNEVVLNLSYITAFCEVLLLDLSNSSEAKERSSKYQDLFWQDVLINGDIEMGLVPRDIITKRAENECYKFLLETINSNYSINQVDTLFKSVGIKFRFKDLIVPLNDLLDTTRKIFSEKNEKEARILIMAAIAQIKGTHEYKYSSECSDISNRMSATIQKITATLRNYHYFSSRYVNFLELLRKDKLKEAEEILLAIETCGWYCQE